MVNDERPLHPNLEYPFEISKVPNLDVALSIHTAMHVQKNLSLHLYPGF